MGTLSNELAASRSPLSSLQLLLWDRPLSEASSTGPLRNVVGDKGVYLWFCFMASGWLQWHMSLNMAAGLGMELNGTMVLE